MAKVRIYEDNDKFWDLLWEKIDRSQHYVCIATYDMDHKTIAGITMQKITNAARRGVKVYLIIDDLNYYADAEQVRKLEAAGGICIRNNPFSNWKIHFFGGRIAKFFNRNHQKVKIVDDCQFIGSLNVADAYSGARYGDAAFRDLNAFTEKHNTVQARHFFRDMLIKNVEHHQDKLCAERIKSEFDQLDLVFPETSNEGNEMHTTFLQETPPSKLEVSHEVL